MIFHKIQLAFLAAMMIVAPVHAQEAYSLDIEFGDDSGAFPNDGECDDRRFLNAAGNTVGMATSLDNENIRRDASDCQRLFEAGVIAPASEEAGRAATICEEIDFGDNSSEWANDRECDDPRFDGPGTHAIMNFEDLLRDANDCRSLCERGTIWLRTAAE